ncbi:Ribosomal protein S18 acetylase RimI [Pseudarthrobacter enclensis]|nr:Ribosomal protein S18 acetylase RimI [Pseudarthrobacter enclensis]
MTTPSPAEPAPFGLEAAMDAAWPAPDRHDAGGWTLRAAAGVTQRANSISPRTAPGGGEAGSDDLPGLLRDARAWYRSRRLPVIFQVFDTPAASALHQLLDAEGFTRQSETLVMTRNARHVRPQSGGTPEVELATEPSGEWLRVWWEVDGRGGEDSLANAETILKGCPSVYALVRDRDGRASAVGRLALPDGSGQGGLYCMATLPDARRQGLAAAILQALLHAGKEHGVHGFWLLVTAANSGAQALYANSGFRESGRYVYRQERPRRALTGC